MARRSQAPHPRGNLTKTRETQRIPLNRCRGSLVSVMIASSSISFGGVSYRTAKCAATTVKSTRSKSWVTSVTEAPCNNRKNTLTMPLFKRILPRLLPRKPLLKSTRAPFAKVLQNLSCCAVLLASATLAIASQNQPPKPVPPPPLVLAGGTIIDVTEWGHSANDIPDAIVYIRDGRVLAVGPRSAL